MLATFLSVGACNHKHTSNIVQVAAKLMCSLYFLKAPRPHPLLHTSEGALLVQV